MRNKGVVIIGISVVSGAVGAAVSHFVTKRLLEQKYLAIAEKEIDEAKTYYSRFHKTEEFSDPADLVGDREMAIPPTRVNIILKEYVPQEEIPDYEEPSRTTPWIEPPKKPNIKILPMPIQEEGWDYEEELATRSRERPYIIHHDEFFQNEHDYAEVTLTYYQGDDVLVDESDEPINEIDQLIGDNNLNRFGHGSKDNNILYIRNEHLSMILEIVRRKTKYTEEVLGYIEHSEKSRKVRRFRSEDG